MLLRGNQTMKTLTLTLILLIGTISAAYAIDCRYNGRSYPPGTVLGPYVCSDNGTWIPRR
jgi:hypothetical protein